MNAQLNTDYDNREKPSQLIAAAVAVLITGLMLGAFEPVANLIPAADASTGTAQNVSRIQQMDTIIVTARRV